MILKITYEQHNLLALTQILIRISLVSGNVIKCASLFLTILITHFVVQWFENLVQVRVIWISGLTALWKDKWIQMQKGELSTAATPVTLTLGRPRPAWATEGDLILKPKVSLCIISSTFQRLHINPPSRQWSQNPAIEMIPWVKNAYCSSLNTQVWSLEPMGKGDHWHLKFFLWTAHVPGLQSGFKSSLDKIQNKKKEKCCGYNPRMVCSTSWIPSTQEVCVGGKVQLQIIHSLTAVFFFFITDR